MSPALLRVRRARFVLAAASAIAALLWAACAGAAVLLLSALLHALGALPNAVAAYVIPAAVVVAVAVLGVTLWRARFLRSIERVALWLEERVPELGYTLVTAVDPRFAGPSGNGADRFFLGDVAGRADLDGIARRAAGRTLGRAAVGCAVAVAALVLAGGRTPLAAGIGGPGGVDGPAELPNRLAELRAEVEFPAYSGLEPQTLSEPTNVRALIGSHVEFLGAGPAGGVAAMHGSDTLLARAAGDDWSIPLVMPAKPAVLEFRDRAYERLVVLEPVTDSAPNLTLLHPARDTTYRYAPAGRLALEAEIEDDFGIDAAYFEILASSGGAESFETVDRSTAKVSFDGRRGATLRASVSFAELKFTPGAVLHIRAIAFDRNDVTGPGRGVSETRTLRVATPEEYDTTSITAAPPVPIDSLFVSQRLLNMRTDTLIRVRRPRIDQNQYVDTSIKYSNDQETIRQRVEKVIAILEDDGVGGRSPTAASKLLRQASEEMWQARAFLAIGFPDSALTPFMVEALRLLDEARTAQRYYIRGVLRARPVNLARVRLQGEDTAAAAPRTPRPVPEDLRRELLARLERVAPLFADAPRAATDSLIYLRVDALEGAPAVAAALQEAIDLALEGEPNAPALARARRLLEPPTRLSENPAEWVGGPL